MYTIKKIKKQMRGSVYLPFIIVGMIVLIAAFFIIKGFVGSPVSSAAPSDKAAIEEPKAEQNINKVLYFPLKDKDGSEVAKIRYEIQDAELRNQIIVKGQKAQAIKGRMFLVVNIKITNDYQKPIELRARDYLRLKVGSSKEQLAPEIHNDPVEVQALSTKYTRVGFTIDDNEENLKLIVGEIGGKKSEIPLNLK